MTSLPRILRTFTYRLTTPTTTNITRSFSLSPRLMAEGDTGAVRRGGQAHADSWTRREKAAEDMYIKEREKSIMQMLREKIAAQEALLAQDRAMLAAMEDQYGHVSEERGNW